MTAIDKIIITSWPLKGNDQDILRGDDRDPELVDAVTEYVEKKCSIDDIEVFQQNGNVIVTSAGFFAAYRESQLTRIIQ